MMLSFLFKRKDPRAQQIALWAIDMAEKNVPSRFSHTSENEQDRIQKFETITPFLCLALWGCGKGGKKYNALSQQTYDAFFALVDGTLREQGVGDLKVGKQVKKFARALSGRLERYSLAFEKGSADMLHEGLTANKYGSDAEISHLTACVMAAHDRLTSTSLDVWLASITHSEEKAA